MSLKQHSPKTGTSEVGRRLASSLREAAAHLRGEIKLESYNYCVPDHVDVRAIRKGIGLSQAAFAAKYALNRRTIQEWEQGRAKPDLSTRAYLTVIARNHKAVEDALATTK